MTNTLYIKMKHYKKLLAVVLSLFLLTGLLPFKAEAASEPSICRLTIEVNFIQSDARQMLDMINEFRLSSPWYWADAGSTEVAYAKDLKPLQYDYKLEKAAMQRAAEMAVMFAHTRPNGDSYYSAADEQGITYDWLLENGAWGYTSASSCFEGLKEEDDTYYSQGHRRAMLNSYVTAVGIGHVRYNGIDFWAQEFAEIPLDQITTSPTSVSTAAKKVTMEVSEDRLSLSSLSFSQSEATIGIGANFAPEETSVSGYCSGSVYSVSFSGTIQMNWVSSNVKVLKPKGDGKFRSLKPGKSIMTASLGGQNFQLVVTVDKYLLISGSITVDEGGSAKFSVYKNSNIATYAWQVSKDGGSTWKNISTTSYPSAATYSLSFNAKATMSGYKYRCKATFSDGTVIYSKVSTLTVKHVNKITTHPSNKSVTEGTSVTLKVVADGQVKSYQWQVSKDGGTTWKNISTSTYPSAATASLKFTTKLTMNGYKYRCSVTFTDGTNLKSNIANLTVKADNKITAQPADASVSAGKSASFTVAVKGDVSSYVWQVSKDSGTTWKNVSAVNYPSALTASLSFKAKQTMNGFLYRCVVTFTDGTVLTSNTALLTVQ